MGHKLADDGSRFEVILDGQPVGTVSWEQLGEHSMHNALAAIAAARHAGVPVAEAIAALAEFDRAIEACPDSLAARFNRGTILNVLGRSDQAVEDFNKARELEKLYPEVTLQDGRDSE